MYMSWVVGFKNNITSKVGFIKKLDNFKLELEKDNLCLLQLFQLLILFDMLAIYYICDVKAHNQRTTNLYTFHSGICFLKTSIKVFRLNSIVSIWP